MALIHVWPSGLQESEGRIVAAATVELGGREKTSLWYRVPASEGLRLTDAADPFVVALLLTAMEEGQGMRVHGEVSPSLLDNLEEFQSVWARWVPRSYRRVDIVADAERERPAAADGALVAFSGGLDSCFTVFRHATGRAGRQSQRSLAGLVVQGFDVPLEEPETFASVAAKAAAQLKSFEIPLYTMATNFQALRQNWDYAFGPAIVSCLMFYQTAFGTALIASSESYDDLFIPCGSNPITDHMLSSDSFRIVHDGAAYSRIEKARELTQWSAGMRLLRVCWAGERKDRNCGRCEKCIRTILDFRLVSPDLPPAFERDVTDEDILGLRALTRIQVHEFDMILQAAEKAKIDVSWVRALKTRLRRNLLRGRLSAWDRKYLWGISRRLYGALGGQGSGA
jgi:hypothetical protein